MSTALIDNELALILIAARRITAAGEYHCFVDYSGHVERVDLRVHPSSTKYEEGESRADVLYKWLYLDREDSLSCVTKARQQLEALENISHCPTCGCPSVADGPEAPEDQAPEAQS